MSGGKVAKPVGKSITNDVTSSGRSRIPHPSGVLFDPWEVVISTGATQRFIAWRRGETADFGLVLAFRS
jgi:hypothetical protein